MISDITQSLANPPSTFTNIYAIIIAVADSGHTQGYLKGVEGDLPLIFDKLAVITTQTPRVITDVESRVLGSRTRALPSTLQSVKATIEEVGQALKKDSDGLCYIYIGGHVEANTDETASMLLRKDEYLQGHDLASWLKSATSGGGTIIAIADVCHSTAFLRMPIIYNLNNDGSPYCNESGGKEASTSQGQVVVVSSTQHGQLARTINNGVGAYPGYHGFFTWVLFKYLEGKSQQVDAAELLLHLRQQCAKHPEKPLPQLSATTKRLPPLPLGGPLA